MSSNQDEPFRRDPKGSVASITRAILPRLPFGSRLCILLVLVSCAVSGCRHARQNRDVVERDLRHKENQVRELQDALHKQTWLNHAMEQQLAEQHQQQLSSSKVIPADPGT